MSFNTNIYSFPETAAFRAQGIPHGLITQVVLYCFHSKCWVGGFHAAAFVCISQGSHQNYAVGGGFVARLFFTISIAFHNLPMKRVRRVLPKPRCCGWSSVVLPRLSALPLASPIVLGNPRQNGNRPFLTALDKREGSRANARTAKINLATPRRFVCKSVCGDIPGNIADPEQPAMESFKLSVPL